MTGADNYHADKPGRRPQKTFSGKHSIALWNAIEKVKNEKTNWAIRELACYCEELESLVFSLEKRIAKLEGFDA